MGNTNHKINVGIISFAHMHAVSYLNELLKMDHVQVVGIADEQSARVEAYAEKYKIPHYSDHKDLLNADVDAVIICSENIHHAKLTIDAANAGKHVLCEKPLGIEMESMHQMIEACKQSGVQLMTAFPCRYIPAVAEAKAAVERGEIGNILAIKGTNRGTMPGGWFVDKALSGGGAILDHTVHVADLIYWFLRSTATEVYAEGGTLFHDLDIDDAGMVHLKFDSGVVAVIDPSWSRAKSFPVRGDVTMEIIGTEGVLQVDAYAQKFDIYSDDAVKAEWRYWGDSANERMIKDFIRSLQEDIPMPITGEDGMNAVAAAIAAYESVRLRKPIRLSSGREPL